MERKSIKITSITDPEIYIYFVIILLDDWRQNINDESFFCFWWDQWELGSQTLLITDCYSLISIYDVDFFAIYLYVYFEPPLINIWLLTQALWKFEKKNWEEKMSRGLVDINEEPILRIRQFLSITQWSAEIFIK